MGFAPNNVILCDTKGVVYQGRTEGMNQWKSAHAVETAARTLADAMEGADAVFGLSVKGALHARDGALDGAESDHLRHGQSRSRDHAGGGGGDPRRRHHGDGPLRLSEPGQQRARLPLHLPRRARRARDDHQHGDEDRRRAGAGRARARGRAGRGRRRLSGLAPALRARLHHPGAVRSAPDRDRAAGRGAGRDGYRRRAPADRRHARPTRRSSRRGAIPSPARSTASSSACAVIRSAWSSPKARRSR